MFNLWKPITPVGVESTWSPVIIKSAAGEMVKQAWYFNTRFPWLGMAICAPVIGLWYWCTDQYIVQRALGAPNEKIARRGSIFAGVLKLFPVYLFIIPGLICFALAKSGKVPGLEVVYDAATGKATQHAQGAFPLMVQYLLPVGIRGIVVAGLLSALMGSLAGVFNACSTLFTVDIYQKFKPQAPQSDLVRMGRTATIVLVIIAFAWIPVVKGSTGLYNYLQSVQGYLAPPIFVVFFLGVFWKRLNAKGCLWAMIVGIAVGLFRMFVDTVATLEAAPYKEGSFLWIVNNINFQYFSILITLLSAIVMIAVSYATEKPDYATIQNLTFATRTDEHRLESKESWRWYDVAASILVISVIIGGYLYFVG
jgi:SSS family solute:Na+ symporter